MNGSHSGRLNGDTLRRGGARRGPRRFAAWFVVFTVGSVLLLRDPTSSLGLILFCASAFVPLSSKELRRPVTSREVLLALLGPLLLLGAAFAISVFAPGALARLGPKAHPTGYRVLWAAVWVVGVVLESRRTFRKPSRPTA